MLDFLIRSAQPILCTLPSQAGAFGSGYEIPSHFISVFSGADGLFHCVCLAFIDFCLFYDLTIVYF